MIKLTKTKFGFFLKGFNLHQNFKIMRNKITGILGTFALVLMLASCSITLPVTATDNAVGSRVGTAKATGFFGILFFNADASIRTAAKNGGITKISTVDIKHTNVLNIIVTYETIVTGE